MSPEPWPADARRDRLIGDWHLYQRTGGHRTSTDDVLTAWHACRGWSGAPERYLDLGCGIGSVLLAVVHRLRPSHSLGVEAQAQSVAMLRRTLAELPEEGRPRVEIECGDFRAVPIEAGAFDLVTGSPPYFPVGTGVLPDDPQRLACRFETRGGVEAYCEVAARALARDGRFHLVFQTQWDDRVLAAASAADLHLHARCDVHARADRDAPFLTLYDFRRSRAEARCEAFAVRTPDGAITDAYAAARAAMGFSRS